MTPSEMQAAEIINAVNRVVTLRDNAGKTARNIAAKHISLTKIGLGIGNQSLFDLRTFYSSCICYIKQG